MSVLQLQKPQQLAFSSSKAVTTREINKLVASRVMETLFISTDVKVQLDTHPRLFNKYD